MQRLDEIAEQIRQSFDQRTAARDRALAQARLLTRHCANAIRAAHRDEQEAVERHLAEARQLVNALRSELAPFPDLYYAGYTQDALKEFAEAKLVYALLDKQPIPTPGELGLEDATYLQGLAEAVGELRRRCLDALLKRNCGEAERLLECMDDIYAVLVTIDYPDALTSGLRRLTDIARSIIERTRGDVTMSLQQERLERNLARLKQELEDLSFDNG